MLLKNFKFTPWFIILACVVCVAVNVFAANKRSSSEKNVSSQFKQNAAPAAKANPVTAEKKLQVYYFMTTYRCRSCTFIEQTTRQALDEQFAAEQKSGRIQFNMINIDETQNKHFVDEYGLYTKSVVLSDLKGGKQQRWKNLDKVWNLIGDEGAFKAYIIKEVNTYLGS